MASTSDLSPAERQRFIMNWLAEKPNISVSDIVRRFSVSEVTARHDLVSLESEGKLRRVRGGAVSLSPLQRNLVSRGAHQCPSRGQGGHRRNRSSSC